jgi:hypothetical protein
VIGMNIQVDKENVEDLLVQLRKFIDNVGAYVLKHGDEKDQKSFKVTSKKLLVCMNRVYHPDLRKIKEESYSLYQAYLNLRNIDKASAEKVYMLYLEKKSEVAKFEKTISSKA